MKTKFLSIHTKYLVQAFLIGILFFLWNAITGLLLHKYFEISLGRQVKFSSTIEAFILPVLIAPIFETLLFQFLIIYQTYESYKGKNVKLLAISISALMFGLSHCYSIHYVAFGIFAGYFLAYIFCYFREKKIIRQQYCMLLLYI
jgi:uncharacterized protein